MNRNDRDYLVQKIRSQYTEREHTELDALRELDKKVKAPVTSFAYIFGTVSALVAGGGMSLIMTDIGSTVGIAEPMLPGITIGIVGMLMAAVNYPIYKRRMEKRRRKYAERIIVLSDKLMDK